VIRWVDNTGAVFVTARTSASSSKHYPGDGVGTGAAGVGAAWGCRGSARAADIGAGSYQRQARRRSQGGRTRLTGRAPKSTGAPSAGGASGAE